MPPSQKIDLTNFISADPDERPHLHVVASDQPVEKTPTYNPPSGPKPITEAALNAAAGESSAPGGLRALIEERAFNFAVAPLPPYPILRLGDRIICTPGNLTGIQGPVKSGKTGVLEAIMAAVFNHNRQGPDTLGFSADNIQGKAMIHIDTEQSRYDCDSLVRRALRRAQVQEPPPWFYSYNLTDFTVAQRKEALDVIVEEAGARHGGVFLIIIDGIADMCASPNDEAEAYALVGRLHTMAIHHDCSILNVLHENPGSENGKMRGHLGSQLERKAETPLRLAKDAASGVTTIWADRARHCHLPREQGICFAWSDEAKMHVSVGTVREIKATAKHSKLREEAEAAFGDLESLSYGDLVAAIMRVTDLKQDSGKKRVKAYYREGIITKTIDGSEQGTYRFVPPPSVKV